MLWDYVGTAFIHLSIHARVSESPLSSRLSSFFLWIVFDNVLIRILSVSQCCTCFSFSPRDLLLCWALLWFPTRKPKCFHSVCVCVTRVVRTHKGNHMDFDKERDSLAYTFHQPSHTHTHVYLIWHIIYIIYMYMVVVPGMVSGHCFNGNLQVH